MRELTVIFFTSSLLVAAPAGASFFEANAADSDDDYLDEEQAEAEVAADKAADVSFETIMQQNAFDQPARRVMPQGSAAVPPMAVPMTPTSMPGPGTGTAEVPLAQYSQVRDRLVDLAEERAQRLAPPVVLGAATYSGEARSESLALHLELQVTLGAPGRWKTVPVAGDSVVVVRASTAGRAIPLSVQNGYHVWVTQKTGEVFLDLDLLIPSRSPRGSIEFDFLIPRTPVTRLICTFPVADLKPHLKAAVRSDITSTASKTRLDATLRPTARVHIVGFRDLGEAGDRQAKIYAESLNLLSVDEGSFDLFTVIRYNILYAGIKEFALLIPKGMKVVSVDGEGGFDDTRTQREDGILLLGKTAFPIRNSYEISLRLRRDIKRSGESFTVPLPRALGVEREHGWLGVEITGKLELEQVAAEKVAKVDVRQLPPEMLDSAVSPILAAYRYHTPEARVQLAVQRLPEQDPESGSIDSVRAHTVVSAEGKALTKIRITLRNRLRHHLTLTLPPETQVRSSLLDGEPIKPSQDADGRVMLQLKRSIGGGRLRPFSLQVVLETELPALGMIGFPRLRLPAFDLPASSVAWTMFLPAHNTYRQPKGDIGTQVYWGTGQWHQPAMVVAPPDAVQTTQTAGLLTGLEGTDGDAGAMPVRIELPEEGKRLDYTRYWLDTGQPAEVSLAFVRTWLLAPLWLVLALLFGLGLLLFADASIPTRRLGFSSWRVGLGLALVTAWPLGEVIGGLGFIVAVVLAGAAFVSLPGRWAQGVELARLYVCGFKAGFAAHRDREDREKVGAAAGLWRLVMAGGLFLFGCILIGLVVRFLFLLGHPLG